MDNYQPMIWPEWVATEESEVVWVRHDAGARALSEARRSVTDPRWSRLVPTGRVAMTRGSAEGTERAWYEACGWSAEPLLRETDDEHDPQDAVLYYRFEVVEP